MDAVYTFDLKQVCGGYAYFSTLTLGSKPDSLGLESREPSLATLDRFSQALKDLNLSYTTINNDRDYYDWTCIQGWGLVEKDYARTNMPQWLKKKKCIISPFGSFTDIKISSDSVRKRTLRGKFKDRILARDGHKCVNCQNTENLTLQHVMPYSKGGETSYRNLVTLCNSCNQRFGADTNRELYRIANLREGHELSLIKNSTLDNMAFARAMQLSSNIMYTRCDIC